MQQRPCLTTGQSLKKKKTVMEKVEMNRTLYYFYWNILEGIINIYTLFSAKVSDIAAILYLLLELFFFFFINRLQGGRREDGNK